MPQHAWVCSYRVRDIVKYRWPVNVVHELVNTRIHPPRPLRAVRGLPKHHDAPHLGGVVHGLEYGVSVDNVFKHVLHYHGVKVLVKHATDILRSNLV